MLDIIVSILLSLSSGADADALRQFDPQDLTTEAAQAHLLSARLAASAYRLDPDLVLAIAWHESHFTIAVTPEHSGLTSCGVMTPEPLEHCVSNGILEGYFQGAAHLKMWIGAARGNLHTALLGYAGGYKLINACAAGPYVKRRGNVDVDICKVADVLVYQRDRIKQLRRARRAS